MIVSGWSNGFSEGFGAGTETAGDVRTLAGLPEGFDLTHFLETANDVVNEELLNKGLSDARLGIIAKFLAAHYAVLAFERGGLIQHQKGESMERYNQPEASNQGYLFTRFGQQAVALDTSGTLVSRTSNKQQARFRVV